jgi:hypothetical protein
VSNDQSIQSTGKKRKLTLFSALLFCLLFCTKAQAKQHEVVLKILNQCSVCGQSCYFSSKDLGPAQRQNLLQEFYIHSSAKLPLQFVEENNLFPVDACVLRGNKKFYKPKNLYFVKSLQTTTIIRTDAVSFAEKNNIKIKQLDIPLNGLKAPDKNKLKYLVKALDELAQASPSRRAYVSCFFGRHRTGLLVGMYQFVKEYKTEPGLTCSQLGTQKDKAFVSMNAIAAQGMLTYDMPSDFRKFYKDFARSVCTEQSEEFLTGQPIKSSK